jgi:hypothetical protein
VRQPAFGIAALLLSEQGDPPPAEQAESGHNGRVLTEFPVAGERGELLDQGLGVIAGMRPVGVTGDLRLLPRGQLGVDFAQGLLRFRFEFGDLLADGDAVVLLAERTVSDLALQVGDRLFESGSFASDSTCGRSWERQTGCGT